METTDKILDRVDLLFNLAKGTPHEAEAALATAKAHALLAKHNLSLADLAARKDPAADDPRDPVDFNTKGMNRYLRDLVFAVIEANFCEGVYVDHGSQIKFTLVGRKVNVITAIKTCEYLIAVVKKETSRQLGPSPLSNEKLSFQHGMTGRLKRRVREQAEADIAEAAKPQPPEPAPVGEGTVIALPLAAVEAAVVAPVPPPTANALVVWTQTEKEANTARQKELWPDLRAARSSGRDLFLDRAAYHAGREAGDRVSLHRQVGGASKPALPKR